MADPTTPEREAKIRAHVARQQETGDLTIGDVYARELLAEVDRLRGELEDAAAMYRAEAAHTTRLREQRLAAIRARDEARAEVEALTTTIQAADVDQARLVLDRDKLRTEVARLRNALGVEVRRPDRPITPSSSGVPDSVVRAWARERGIAHNPKGRVAAEIRNAYEAAWRAEQEGDGGRPAC